jgi:hypothetical protein
MTEDLESQIMFNLIRAKNGMPFAQYDIQQLQSVVYPEMKGLGWIEG